VPENPSLEAPSRKLTDSLAHGPAPQSLGCWLSYDQATCRRLLCGSRHDCWVYPIGRSVPLEDTDSSRSNNCAMELPSLRRNHAHRRTAFRRPTPASIATSKGPLRSMNLPPHPRSRLALLRESRSFVSSDLQCHQSHLYSVGRTTPCDESPPPRHFNAAHHAHFSDLHRHLHQVSPFQST
jgi:hypothetical protein